MNDLERDTDHVTEQKSVAFDTPQMPIWKPKRRWGLRSIGRRWFIILLTLVMICSVGLPSIWLLIKRTYVVTGLIRVDPIISNIFTGEVKSGGVSNYASFMDYQARMVTSSQVVRDVATDLSGKGLLFFGERTDTLAAKIARKLGRKKITPEPEQVLKEAILDELITAAPTETGEVILVSMKWHNTAEAMRIVDAFIRNYMSREVTSATDKEAEQLATLQNEQKLLYSKLENDRVVISRLAQEYGSKKLDARYDMNLKRIGMLLDTLVEAEARRISLQTQVACHENYNSPNEATVDPKEWAIKREEYVNKDAMVIALANNVVALERELLEDTRTLPPDDAEITKKGDVLEALRKRLGEQQEIARVSFNEFMEQETANTSSRKLEDLKNSLEQAQTHESKIRDLLSKEDQQTIDMGTKNLAMLALQDELVLTKEMYDGISRRIEQFKLERKRPARISVANRADITETIDKRAKYTIMLILVSLTLGMLLAMLRDRSDRTLRRRIDIAELVGIPLIGTTTRAGTVKGKRLRGWGARDYQSIRIKLGLFSEEGMPKNLAVMSPGKHEGRTTFAINLAQSVALSGKKVLLIDGDLRKPDVGYFLDIPEGSEGLWDVLSGKEARKVICPCSDREGLHVLPAGASDRTDPFELLSSSMTAERLIQIGEPYDHVIIDTPPMLLFPDAIIWGMISDGVVLSAFADKTCGPDLREAMERLIEIKANVLGTVLSNVDIDDSYYRSGGE